MEKKGEVKETRIKAEQEVSVLQAKTLKNRLTSKRMKKKKAFFFKNVAAAQNRVERMKSQDITEVHQSMGKDVW